MDKLLFFPILFLWIELVYSCEPDVSCELCFQQSCRFVKTQTSFLCVPSVRPSMRIKTIYRRSDCASLLSNAATVESQRELNKFESPNDETKFEAIKVQHSYLLETSKNKSQAPPSQTLTTELPNWNSNLTTTSLQSFMTPFTESPTEAIIITTLASHVERVALSASTISKVKLLNWNITVIQDYVYLNGVNTLIKGEFASERDFFHNYTSANTNLQKCHYVYIGVIRRYLRNLCWNAVITERYIKAEKLVLSKTGVNRTDTEQESHVLI